LIQLININLNQLNQLELLNINIEYCFILSGSYVVSKLSAERAVSYDHGLDGSVAEDCYFSMIAYKNGYTFDFIEGEMWEKSPFTISDFLQQRKRWMQGIFLVVHSPQVPVQNKIFLAMSLYAWLTMPLSTSNLILASLYPIPPNGWCNFLSTFVGAVSIYMYIFGVMKSFSLMRLGLKRFVFCVIGAMLTIPFNVIIENCAVVMGFFGKKHKFYVVQKNFTPTSVV
jgi:beta-1,4-mannosyltransferase